MDLKQAKPIIKFQLFISQNIRYLKKKNDEEK